jgi:serine/threonine protein kinase
MNDVMHANIVRMFELLENESHYFIVTEVMTGGDLYDLIEDKDDGDKPFTQAEIKKVIY